MIQFRAVYANGRVQRLKRVGLAILVACAAFACFSSSAFAYGVSYPGMEKLHFNAGPYAVHPGANLILLDANKVPKPNVDGYMVRFIPNLRLAKRTAPAAARSRWSAASTSITASG